MGTMEDNEQIRSLTSKLMQKYIGRHIDKIKQLDGCEDFVCDNHVRGERSKSHIMYKLKNADGTLSLFKEGRKYEFLVEFDCDDFAYGIYYGCRCTFDPESDIHHQKARCDEEWEHLKGYTITNLNNTFVDIDFSERENPTDNANNATYWPFWFRVGEEENIVEIAALATRIIRNTYHWFFQEENYAIILKDSNTHKAKRGPKRDRTAQTRYTNKEYDKIINRLKHSTIKKSNDTKAYCNGAEIYFERLIETLERHNILSRNTIYERCWVINDMDKCRFADIIAEFSKRISTNTQNISWSLFSPIIMSSNHGVFDDIRKQYGHCKRGNGEIIEHIIREVFEIK